MMLEHTEYTREFTGENREQARRYGNSPMKYGQMPHFSRHGECSCPLEAPHGIFYGILYSLPLWAAIAFVAWEVWR